MSEKRSRYRQVPNAKYKNRTHQHEPYCAQRDS